MEPTNMKSLRALADRGKRKNPRPCPSRPRQWSSSSSLWSEHENITQSSGFITAGEDGGRCITCSESRPWSLHLEWKRERSLFLCGSCFSFSSRHVSKERDKQPTRCRTALSTLLIASSAAVKPITASRGPSVGGVRFMFTVNWKRSGRARLAPVCMRSGCSMF